MNIKLALIESDKLYSSRFLDAMNTFYPQTEVRVFSSYEKAAGALQAKPCDVAFISEDICMAHRDSLDSLGCRTYMILVDNKGVGSVDGITAVCKYRRVDELHSSMVHHYSEVANIVIDLGKDMGKTKLITFTSAAGGQGCSSAAAAYTGFIGAGKKALYLDLDPLGLPETLFRGEGMYTMTDCITALIDKKQNLAVQLNNFAVMSESGTYYYQSAKNALDWSDLTEKERISLVESVVGSDIYDYVIVDVPFGWDSLNDWLNEHSDRIMIVCGGDSISAAKTERLIEALLTRDKVNGRDGGRLSVVYNRTDENSIRIKNAQITVSADLSRVSRCRNTQELVKLLSARNNWIH